MRKAKKHSAKVHRTSKKHSRRGGAIRHSAAHPGFRAVSSHIAHEVNPRTGSPYGARAAAAILASHSRHASSAAKRSNPRLRRVHGGTLLHALFGARIP